MIIKYLKLKSNILSIVIFIKTKNNETFHLFSFESKLSKKLHYEFRKSRNF
jgi:hypothetical protein